MYPNGELAQVLPLCSGCKDPDPGRHQCQDLMWTEPLGMHACGCTCLDPV